MLLFGHFLHGAADVTPNGDVRRVGRWGEIGKLQHDPIVRLFADGPRRRTTKQQRKLRGYEGELPGMDNKTLRGRKMSNASIRRKTTRSAIGPKRGAGGEAELKR